MAETLPRPIDYRKSDGTKHERMLHPLMSD